MTLKEQLMADMKDAMKAKDDGKLRLGVIRMVRSAIRQKEIDGHLDLDDNGVSDVIAKELKQRKDSLAEFEKGGRADLIEKTQAEIQVLLSYLPEQLSEEEIQKLVAAAIEESGAKTPKDMGKVMAILMPKVKGKADGKLVNETVKKALVQG